MILLASQALPTFEEVEKNKYQAFAALTSFKGTYVVVSVPEQGLAVRQEVQLTLGEKGRRIKISVDGNAGLESGWTQDQKWLVSHPNKTYVFKQESKGFKVTNPYHALGVDKGSFNFTVDEYGPRFATDPAAKVTAKQKATLDGAQTVKVDAQAVNAAGNGEVTVTQWFLPDSWYLKRFEVVLTSKGKELLKIVGFLQDANFKASLPESQFQLPAEVGRNYKKVEG